MKSSIEMKCNHKCTGLGQQNKQHRREGACKVSFKLAINTDKCTMINMTRHHSMQTSFPPLGSRRWRWRSSPPRPSWSWSSQRPAPTTGSSCSWWSWAGLGETAVQAAARLRAQLPGFFSTNDSIARKLCAGVPCTIYSFDQYRYETCLLFRLWWLMSLQIVSACKMIA